MADEFDTVADVDAFLRRAVPSSALRSSATSNQYEAKLSFEQRCEIRAFVKSGFKAQIVAAAFGVHRRTVMLVASSHPNVRQYKAVRTEQEKLGLDEFRRRYITEKGVKAIAAAARDHEMKRGEASQSEHEYRQTKAVGTNPNKRKNSHAGLYRDSMDEIHEIVWLEPGNPRDVHNVVKEAGWYDASADEELSLYSFDQSFKSSKLAYDFMTRNGEDPVEKVD